MRVNNINHFNASKTSRPNFKADVIVLPSSAKDDQPPADKFILEKETQKIKEELQRRFPSKNDNLQILLQPSGHRGNADKKKYWNYINAFLGFKDAKRAREDIIRKNEVPPNDDYLTLKSETINKLKNKDPEIMKKLEEKHKHDSEYMAKEDVANLEKTDFVDDIEDIMKDALGYELIEYEEPKRKPYEPPVRDIPYYELGPIY